MNAGLTASVDTAGSDGELLVGTVHNKVEALAVVVGVGVSRATGGVIALVVLASSIGSSSDLSSSVAGATASGGRLTALNGAGDSYAHESGQRGEGLGLTRSVTYFKMGKIDHTWKKSILGKGYWYLTKE